MGYELVTAPTTDLGLISLDEAKLHLRVDQNVEDQLITNLIGVSRSWAEEYTQRAILESGWNYFRDSFHFERIPIKGNNMFVGELHARTFQRIIEIPRPIMVDVTSITYFDTDDQEQTLTEDTDFRVNIVGDLHPDGLANIEPIDVDWPSTRDRKNAVKIAFDAGWPVADVPKQIRQAILIYLAELYLQRQDTIVGMTVSKVDISRRLLDRWKISNI